MTKLLLLEMTLYQLNRSVQNQFGDKRQGKSPRMNLTDVKYSLTSEGGKTGIMVTSHCISGDSGNHYDQVFMFNKIVLDEEDTPENMTVKTTDGKDIHVNYRGLANSDVKVRCTCLDFYWRFAVYNFNKKALYGDRPPPYIKKTSRPPVNPMQKPGVCKHIYKLLNTVLPPQYRH